jgi:hypothetical protein
MLTTNFDTSKIFIGNNRYITGTYTNGGGSTATLTAGQLIGRIASSGKLAVHDSTATDGSQVPIGVLAESYSVAAAASETLRICVWGDVAENKLDLSGSDALTTVISLTDSATNTVKVGTIGDILRSSGIFPVASTELTAEDNQ